MNIWLACVIWTVGMTLGWTLIAWVFVFSHDSNTDTERDPTAPWEPPPEC